LRVGLHFGENQSKPKMENALQCASFQGTKKKKMTGIHSLVVEK
jgi:hypothetical protein